MNCSKSLGRAAALLAIAPMVMTAQRTQETAIPLKNWATPLFWQPSQTERSNAAQIQFSANAISNTALTFVAITPCRLVDTRGAAAGFNGSTPFNGPYLQAQTAVAFPVQSSTEAQTAGPSPCGTIPSIAQAYSLNLTIVPHPLGTPVNFVTMWPNSPGATIPTISTLNDQQGAIVSNAAIVPAGTISGGINVYTYGSADVVIDMNGYFAPPSDLNGNTAIGTGALADDTTGTQNTAIGVNALESNSTGSGKHRERPCGARTQLHRGREHGQW